MALALSDDGTHPVSRLTYAVRSVGGSRRGRRLLTVHILGAFGVVSAIVQFVDQLAPGVLPAAGATISASVALCVIWGIWNAVPKLQMSHDFSNPHLRISVVVGDLFQQDADLVVGFSDFFDAATGEAGVISATTVQGQLLERVYGGDGLRLDRDLENALTGTPPIAMETRDYKQRGKLARFEMGTVAVIAPGRRRIYATAYSRMDGNGVARSSVQDLWLSLDRLWSAIDRHGERHRVAMPVIGSGLARVDALGRGSLLRMILLSFVARSRQSVPCTELVIVIHPNDLPEVDLLEVKAFLKAL